MTLEEKKLTSTLKHQASFFQVYQDKVELPNGNHAYREYIKHPGAVAIVPLFENGDTLLLRQYRYPIQEVLLEIPAGKIDPGETPEETAARELAEETGYQSLKITKLICFFVCPGYSNETMDCYIAENLNPSQKKPEQDEFLDIIKMPLREALEKIKTQEIKDSKSILSLQQAKSYCINQGLKKHL